MQVQELLPNGHYARSAYGAGERPAFIEFETRAFEDRAASQKDGVLRYKDVDIVIVRSPGSTASEFEAVAEDWLNLRREARDQYYPAYKQHFEAWKEGKEPTVIGTPLEKWPGISPAEVKNCKACHVLSVEDLAAVNEDGLRRIGMGSRTLKDRAKAWLESASQGQVAEELASLRVQVESMIGALAEKDKTISEQQQIIHQYMAQDSVPIAASAEDAMDVKPLPKLQAGKKK